MQCQNLQGTKATQQACAYSVNSQNQNSSPLSDLSKQLKWNLFVPSHLTCQTEKWKEPRVLGLHAATPPVTSPTEGAARHRNDGTVQILNMFWHGIKSCSPLWGRDSPFSVWSLIRPQGERGRNTDTPEYSLCTFLDIFFLFFFFADLGIVSHFEISFHSKIEALISPHLRLMKSHKWSMRIPAWLAGFYLPHILLSGAQSSVCCCSISDYSSTEDLTALLLQLWQQMLSFF